MIRLLLACYAFIFLESCYVARAYKYRQFSLDDLEKLDAVQLPPSNKPFVFAYDSIGQASLKAYLDSNLARSLTYAFLVIKNDSIMYEGYFGDVNESSKLPSFSVAKSFVSALVGIALEEGFIKNVNDPVTAYLPSMRNIDKGYDQVTIQQLLDMRSGVESNENYSNPFSDVLKMGFARNVGRTALKTKLDTPPGTFHYRSVNTQLLALILEKATGRSLQDYAKEKLWAPLNMEFMATWNDDKKDRVRAFCCINAAARDFAKFGLLYLKQGHWQSQQVVPASWVKRSVDADTLRLNGNYKNQWWSDASRRSFTELTKAQEFAASHPLADIKTHVNRNGGNFFVVSYPSGSYHAEGILGQFIYVNPAKNLVIVRLGQNWSHPSYYAQGFIYHVGANIIK
ncbi:MAG: serine hydrolase domain-containing protein [Flavisolibacter sp.]